MLAWLQYPINGYVFCPDLRLNYNFNRMRHILRFSFLAAIVAASASCHRHAKPSDMPMLEVEVVRAQSDTLYNSHTFIGYLYSATSVAIQPRVNGYLIAAPYSAGMPVRRGEKIFEIDPQQISTALASAEAQLLSARAQLSAAKSNYERAVPLARIEAISQAQLDQYRSEYAAAEASVRSAEQSVKNNRINVGYTVIRAPISGIIATDKASVGDYVGPGTAFEQLTTIANVDTMSVKITIPISLYLQYQQPGQASFDNEDLLSDIRLSLADSRRYPIAGIYDYTVQSISTSAGTIDMVVRFPNPDAELKPGEFARITLSIGPRKPVVTVPQQAVDQTQGINSVWVVNANSTAEYRQVVLGDKYGDRWGIADGVHAGEQVVVSGRGKLRNAERVKIKTE